MSQAGLAETYVFLRRWKEAEDTARHALTMDPHEATAMRMLLLSSLEPDRECAGTFAATRDIPAGRPAAS